MPRPLASDRQRMIAYRLHKRGFGPAAILRELKDTNERGDLGEFEDVVSLRTIKNWLAGFRDRDAGLDDPFEWQRLDEYGLPWEASSFLLSMWFNVQNVGWMLEEEYDLPALSSPTVRQARWWWRIHQLVPEVESKLDIYLWAEAFVRYELFKDILGKPVDVTGLWAYLAYKPWEGDFALDLYNIAWTRGRITPLPGGFEHFPLEQELRAIQGDPRSVPGGIDALKPGKLPSKVFHESLDRLKPLVEKKRALGQEIKDLKQEQSTQEETA